MLINLYSVQRAVAPPTVTLNINLTTKTMRFSQIRWGMRLTEWLTAVELYSGRAQVSSISMVHFTGTVSEAPVTRHRNEMVTNRWTVSGSFGFSHVYIGGAENLGNIEREKWLRKNPSECGWKRFVRHFSLWHAQFEVSSWQTAASRLPMINRIINQVQILFCFLLLLFC